MLRPSLSIFVFIASLHFLVPQTAFSQGETTSAIVGQVNDPTHAAVPGATVTITNQDTGLNRVAKTDDSGQFNFPQLKPGTYSVKVESTGFATQQNSNVVSGLGEKQIVDFTLKLAESEQTARI
jgi:hypothetical protein